MSRIVHQSIDLSVDATTGVFEGVADLYVSWAWSQPAKAQEELRAASTDRGTQGDARPRDGGKALSPHLELHSMGLSILDVHVEGYPATFRHRADDKDARAAGAGQAGTSYPRPPRETRQRAAYQYKESSQQEISLYDLIIDLPKAVADGARDTAIKGSDGPPVLLVTVRYVVPPSPEGVHGPVRMEGGFCMANSIGNRTRAWFPCQDGAPDACGCSFQIKVTVPRHHTAVASGTLVDHALLGDGRTRRLEFHLEEPVPPSSVALVVGPLTMYSPQPLKEQEMRAIDKQDGLPPSDVSGLLPVASFARPALKQALRDSTGFLSIAWELARKFFGSQLPVPSYTQVFLPPELLTVEPQLYAGLAVFSEEHLAHYEQPGPSRAVRFLQMEALVGQVFGVHLMVKRPAYRWLLLGLQRHVSLVLMQRVVGKDEVAYRRVVEREAVARMDDGTRPPLEPVDKAYSLYTPDWSMAAVEGETAAGEFYRWKATAVMDMIMAKLGEDLFRKQLQRLLQLAAQGDRKVKRKMQRPNAAPGTEVEVEGGEAGGANPEDNGAPPVRPAPPPPAPSQTERAPVGPSHHWQPQAPPSHVPRRQVLEDMLSARLMTSKAFLREFGRSGVLGGAAYAFQERWVSRSGAPHITAAASFDKKTYAIELAVRQDGSPEALAGAQKAREEGEKRGTGVGTIKLYIHEVELGTASGEHVVALGDDHVAFHESRVMGKWGGPKRGPRRKKGQAAADKDELEDIAAELQPEGRSPEEKTPLRWMLIDPAGEWLCVARVLQPEWMMVQQLENGNTVLARYQALRGIRALFPWANDAMAPVPQDRVDAAKDMMNVLKSFAEKKENFVRLRTEAVLLFASLARPVAGRSGQAIASSQAPFHSGRDFLVRFAKERGLDPRLKAMEAPDSRVSRRSVDELLLDEALPLALARIRDEEGRTPAEVIELLLDALENSSGPRDTVSDESLTAALVEGLGMCSLRSGDLARVTEAISRFLEREKAMMSHKSIISVACLRTLVRLSLTHREPDKVLEAGGASGSRDDRPGPQTMMTVPDVLKLLKGYTDPRASEGSSVSLRSGAHECIMTLVNAKWGALAAIQYAVDTAVTAPDCDLVTLSLLRTAMDVASSSPEVAAQNTGERARLVSDIEAFLLGLPSCVPRSVLTLRDNMTQGELRSAVSELDIEIASWRGRDAGLAELQDHRRKLTRALMLESITARAAVNPAIRLAAFHLVTKLGGLGQAPGAVPPQLAHQAPAQHSAPAPGAQQRGQASSAAASAQAPAAAEVAPAPKGPKARKKSAAAAAAAAQPAAAPAASAPPAPGPPAPAAPAPARPRTAAPRLPAPPPAQQTLNVSPPLPHPPAPINPLHMPPISVGRLPGAPPPPAAPASAAANPKVSAGRSAALAVQPKPKGLSFKLSGITPPAPAQPAAQPHQDLPPHGPTVAATLPRPVGTATPVASSGTNRSTPPPTAGATPATEHTAAAEVVGPPKQKMKFTMKLSAKRVKEEELGDAALGDPNKKAKN